VCPTRTAGAKTDGFYATILAPHEYALSVLEACGGHDSATLARWLQDHPRGEAAWPSSNEAKVEGVYLHYVLATRKEFLEWAARADHDQDKALAKELRNHAGRLNDDETLGCMVRAAGLV